VGGYAYAVSDDSIWVNLYIRGSAEMTLNGCRVVLKVATDYPWDGAIKITVKPADAVRFSLKLRIPGWCDNASVKLNGGELESVSHNGGYLILDRVWRSGDTVKLKLQMPVRMLESNPQIKENRGRIALQRGPIIYCLESCDQVAPLDTIALPLDAAVKPEWKPDLLGGVVVLKAQGVVRPNREWRNDLYRPLGPSQQATVIAVPYYAWNNRGIHKMEVWVRGER
jgi:DUF1680 family protein